MATDYSKHLEFILQELHLTTRGTAAKLEALRALHDPITVFYVAYVILCLQLQTDRDGVQILVALTQKDLAGYLPLETMPSSVWTLIDEVVQCFCAELHVEYPELLASG